MSIRKLGAVAIVAVVAAILIGVVAVRSSAGGDGTSVVMTEHAGGKTLLANKRGRTLYRLSVERRGHFICTNGMCLAVWKPLVVARGTKPAGAHSLGTVRRPDGRLQVTYKGGPLYTFVQDRKPGDMKGDGFKDVGVWHAVVVSGTSSAPAQAPSGGGYGY
jgi:predicted lipoprotein with Yx(FWY)xxD motif